MRKGFKYLIVLNEINSTNNYANHLVKEKCAKPGTVVLTHYQYQGRGQPGNHWESDRGRNMLASIILYPDFLPPEYQFYLSKIASISLADWLVQEIKNVKIKWPNDIYVDDDKIAGILIETAVLGNALQSAIIGVGLNLNQESFNPDLPNPVSLKQLTGKEYDLEKVALQIRNNLMGWNLKLKRGQYNFIDETYVKNLYRLNEWAGFIKEGLDFEARITGVDTYGKLILEKRSGDVFTCSFREISFII